MSERLRRATEPAIRVGMYGWSRWRRSFFSVPIMLFGPLPWPLAVAISRSLPEIARALGYHSVGIKPMGSAFGVARPLRMPKTFPFGRSRNLITAIASREALAA